MTTNSLSAPLRFKDPAAKLDYRWDFAEYLGDDEIDTATVTVPDGIEKESEENDATSVTVWLSGGTLGDTYRIVFQITTTGGRIDERTLRVKIMDR